MAERRSKGLEWSRWASRQKILHVDLKGMRDGWGYLSEQFSLETEAPGLDRA